MHAPLAGLIVAVTAARRGKELAQMITNLGGIPYLAPTVAIQPSPNPQLEMQVRDFLKALREDREGFAVFMTAIGAESIFAAARAAGLETAMIDALQHVTVVARSSKPQSLLAKYGIRTNVIVPEENTVNGIIELMKGYNIAGRTIVVSWHGSSSPKLIEILQAAGANVIDFSTYRYGLELGEDGARLLSSLGFHHIPPDESKVINLIADLNRGAIDAITFTSPPSAQNLFNIAKKHKLTETLLSSLTNNCVVVAVGPSTRGALEENRIQSHVMPGVYKLGPMMQALTKYLEQTKQPPGGQPARVYEEPMTSENWRWCEP